MSIIVMCLCPGPDCGACHRARPSGTQHAEKHCGRPDERAYTDRSSRNHAPPKAGWIALLTSSSAGHYICSCAKSALIEMQHSVDHCGLSRRVPEPRRRTLRAHSSLKQVPLQYDFREALTTSSQKILATRSPRLKELAEQGGCCLNSTIAAPAWC